MSYGLAYTAPRLWHVVDAKDQVLGRLSNQVARLLAGKHKPSFAHHIDAGDHVVVLNARAVALTGKKPTAKLYRWHTGWMGGLKTLTARQLMERNPARLVEKAVRGMLPMNNSRDVRMGRLRVYAGEEGLERHAQQLGASRAYAPQHLALSKPRDVRPLFLLRARQRGAILGDARRILGEAELAELDKRAADLKHDAGLQAEYEAWLAKREAREAGYAAALDVHVAARARELEEEDATARAAFSGAQKGSALR